MERKITIVTEICAQLAEQENLKETVYESAKGAGIAGASAMLGGLIGGRNGLLIGGAIGGALGCLLASNFKSIPDIIREDLTDTQKRMLFSRINELLRNVALTDVPSVMQLLAVNVALKANVLSTLKSFLKHDMELSI